MDARLTRHLLQEKTTLTSQLEALQLRVQRAETLVKKKGVGEGDGKVAENVQRELALMTSAWYGTYQTTPTPLVTVF